MKKIDLLIEKYLGEGKVDWDVMFDALEDNKEKKLFCPKCKCDRFDRTGTTSVNIYIDKEDDSLRDDIVSSEQMDYACSNCGFEFSDEDIENKLLLKQD